MINEELKCVGICKSYKDKEVLKDINLTIEPNKIYGMIGRNGAGNIVNGMKGDIEYVIGNKKSC